MDQSLEEEGSTDWYRCTAPKCGKVFRDKYELGRHRIKRHLEIVKKQSKISARFPNRGQVNNINTSWNNLASNITPPIEECPDVLPSPKYSHPEDMSTFNGPETPPSDSVPLNLSDDVPQDSQQQEDDDDVEIVWARDGTTTNYTLPPSPPHVVVPVPSLIDILCQICHKKFLNNEAFTQHLHGCNMEKIDEYLTVGNCSPANTVGTEADSGIYDHHTEPIQIFGSDVYSLERHENDDICDLDDYNNKKKMQQQQQESEEDEEKVVKTIPNIEGPALPILLIKKNDQNNFTSPTLSTPLDLDKNNIDLSSRRLRNKRRAVEVKVIPEKPESVRSSARKSKRINYNEDNFIKEDDDSPPVLKKMTTTKGGSTPSSSRSNSFSPARSSSVASSSSSIYISPRPAMSIIQNPRPIFNKYAGPHFFYLAGQYKETRKLMAFNLTTRQYSEVCFFGTISEYTNCTLKYGSGCIYILGGQSGGLYGKASDQVHVFDITTGQWSAGKIPKMINDRCEFESVVVDDHIYALGGDQRKGKKGKWENMNCVERLPLRPTPGRKWKWENVDFMECSRQNFGVAALNKVIYVVGGYAGKQKKITSKAAEATKAVESFDCTENDSEWTYEPELSTPRVGPCAVTTDEGLLYCIGGGTQFDETLTKKFNTVEIFNPTRKFRRWAEGPKMKRKRQFFSSFYHNKCIYAVGGDSGDDKGYTMEMLDLGALDPSWSMVDSFHQEGKSPLDPNGDYWSIAFKD